MLLAGSPAGSYLVRRGEDESGMVLSGTCDIRMGRRGGERRGEGERENERGRLRETVEPRCMLAGSPPPSKQKHAAHYLSRVWCENLPLSHTHSLAQAFDACY